jgi:anthranilate/para-aminobenzoate synthase component II
MEVTMRDRIFIPNDAGGSYAYAVEGLGNITSDFGEFFRNLEQFKLVLFTGGEDVCPREYGDTSPKGLCGCNPRRDYMEKEVFKAAVAHNMKITGICRGAQFANVMSGGKMMHHITGHGVYHGFVPLNDQDNPIEVSSTHHQMIIPPEDGFIIGWSEHRRSNVYVGAHDKRLKEDRWPAVETEAVLIPRTHFAGVQYHPEYMQDHTDGYQWYWNMVLDLLTLDIADFTKKYVTGAEDGIHKQVHTIGGHSA